MNKCPKCSSEYKTGETECQKCGIIFEKYAALQKKQIAKKQSLMMKCKVCDKKISKNARACPYCGEPNKIENNPSRFVSKEIRKLSKEMIKCEKCGATFHRKIEKCPKCNQSNKKAKHLSPSQVLFFLIIAFVVLWFMASNDKPNRSKTQPTAPKTQPTALKIQPTITKTQEEIRKEQIQKHFSFWDGSHRGLTAFIKKSMHDPDSYKHVETVYGDKGEHLIVRTTFRGKNKFGGVVKNSITAKVDLNGNVINIISQDQ